MDKTSIDMAALIDAAAAQTMRETGVDMATLTKALADAAAAARSAADEHAGQPDAAEISRIASVFSGAAETLAARSTPPP